MTEAERKQRAADIIARRQAAPWLRILAHWIVSFSAESGESHHAILAAHLELVRDTLREYLDS